MSGDEPWINLLLRGRAQREGAGWGQKGKKREGGWVGGGRCERKKKTKQRWEDRASTVCLSACIGVEMTDGLLYDICLCAYMCAGTERESPTRGTGKLCLCQETSEY